MALSVRTSLTEYADADDATGWNVSGSSETDWNIEGSACRGVGVDAETYRFEGPILNGGAGFDWSTGTGTPTVVYCWMMCATQSTLATQSSHGMYLGIKDSSANYSYWDVAGLDTYKGGWEVFTFSTDVSPDWNSGTPADLTDCYRIVMGFTCTAKTKITYNCFVDWIRFGALATPALEIYGSTTTAGTAWSEAYSLDIAAAHGIIHEIRPGYYILKGSLELGDSSSTNATDFTDDQGTILVFDRGPVSDSVYKLAVVANSTGTTDLTFGTVVGSGNSRQGTQGVNIATAGSAWEWDSATDIAQLSTVQLYGSTFKGASAGFNMDGMSTSSDSSAISCTWINSYGPFTGSSNNGAEILNSFIIDPTGVSNNYGLAFEQTPSGGTLSHNVSNISFITSGAPTTQYMVYFSYAGDYAIAFSNMQYFGTYTSSTIQNGINTGSNADIVINATGTTNADETDFTNTASGTVDVQASVVVKVTVKNRNNIAISGAQTSVYLTSDGTEILNTDSDGSGEAETTFSGTTPANVVIRVRKSSTGTRYENFSTTGIIQTNTGLDTTVILTQDLNVS